MSKEDIRNSIAQVTAENDQKWACVQDLYGKILDELTERELIALNKTFEQAVASPHRDTARARLMTFCPTLVFALADTAMG